MPHFLKRIDHEILVALAWAAPLTSAQIRRLVEPDMHPNGIANHLAQLYKWGYVERTWATQPLPKRKKSAADAGFTKQPSPPPKPIGYIWSLSADGYSMLVEQARSTAEVQQIPPKPASVRHRNFLEHDLTLSEFLVRIVEWGRPFLSGIFIDREVRLDATRRAPICDGILVVRYHPEDAQQLDVVPWVNSPPSPEERIQAYALEIDMNSEPIGTIRDKALNYDAIWRDSDFYRRYKKMPVPLWIVPKRGRLESIMRAWRATWEPGRWLITTHQGLQDDKWVEYWNGQRRTHPLFEGWIKE